MISVWKKFINKDDSSPASSNDPYSSSNGIPHGIQKLDKELQRKFAHGVNYNLKIVIKGDARVGKTALFRRLEGHEFEDNLLPTENLTVTSINWNYKATDDIVKIDLWEAIDSIWRKSNHFVDLKAEQNDQSGLKDRGKPENVVSTAKLAQNNKKHPIPESARQSLAEASENLDVYQRADAVLLVFDMTKLWTFKYVQAELPKIPKQIPILVIANHRDQGHHRTVSSEQVRAHIEGLVREPGDAVVMYTEASMKNGFGLNLIKKFFNIPFLKLQEASLLKQLELNRCDYMTTSEELQFMQESIDQEYERFLELKTIIRRQQADAMSPVNSGLRQLDDDTREKIRSTTMSSGDVQKDLSSVKSIESNNNDKRSTVQSMTERNFVNNRMPSIVIGAKCSLPETKAIQLNLSDTKKVDPRNGEPDHRSASYSDESEDDEIPRGNPLVAGYQSDLDSDDQLEATKRLETC